MDQKNSVNVSQISGRLAGHVAALAEMTEFMGDGNSTYTLRHLEPRLRQGLVRIAFVGVTSTGKSTAINALIGQLALPENPSVSSPIPVWIGYQDQEASQAEIYLTKKGGLERTTCDLKTFKREYCYNIEDIANRDRSRYNAVEFGAIKTMSPLLEGGLTIIDTLGIAATTVDSRKTIRVLKEGMDAVVFVTKSANLNLDERRFLYQYILGCRGAQSHTTGGEIEPFQAVSPENLFFVYNDWYGVPAKTAFQESVRNLFRSSGLGLDEDAISRLANDNVFFVNAFQGRLGALGAYPYVECAPEGSTAEALDSLQELEDYEKEELDYSDGAAQLLSQSGIPELAEAITRKAWQLCHGKNAVGVRRISELVPVIDGVIRAADQRISDINLTMEGLQKQKEAFAKLREDDDLEQARITSGFMSLNKKYKESFTRLLQVITPGLKSDCGGKALQIPKPAEFSDQYSAYLRMNIEDKEKYLQAMLPEQIRSTYEYCAVQLLKELDERRTDDYKTPFAVMEETRSFIARQTVLLNARVTSLQQMGAVELGAVLPEPIIVEELFRELQLDLEEKVKEIIANSCRMSGEKFKKTMKKHVKRCRLNIISRLIPGAADRLWDRIRRELFQPLAESIVDDMPEDTGESIFMETTAAFNEISTKICRSHIQLFVSLETTLARLEERLSAQGDQRNEETAKAAELRHKCEEIKDDILRMQHALQNG